MSLYHQVKPTEPTAAGDEPLHLVCCDDNTALCGEDVTDAHWEDDQPDEEICPMCGIVQASGIPCGPECPDAGDDA